MPSFFPPKWHFLELGFFITCFCFIPFTHYIDMSYLAGVLSPFLILRASPPALLSAPVWFSPSVHVLCCQAPATRGGGPSLPPFWNPSPSSLLTGLGPEPLLRFGELTQRLEPSRAIFRVWRGLAGVIPSPVRCWARRGAQLLRRSGGQCVRRQRLRGGRRSRWIFQAGVD